MKKSYVIDNESAQTRLDIFLAKTNLGIPRRFFQTEIKNGNILVNREKVKPSYVLKKDDHVELGKKVSDKSVHPSVHQILPDPKIPFKIVFENKDFAVIEKPAGLSVHPSRKEKDGTLVNGLLNRFLEIKDVGEDPLRPGIVHRLDKDTSGLLIVALNQKSFEYLKNLFKNRKIEKKYAAVCWGLFERKKGKIESFIGRSSSDPLKQSTSTNPGKIRNPKKAVTNYEVLKESGEMSLVELAPKTGRMHQLRIHLHSIGHSVVGDKKYQTKLVKKENSRFKRHLLHATELKFVFNDKKYKFSSRPPEEFDHTMNKK